MLYSVPFLLISLSDVCLSTTTPSIGSMNLFLFANVSVHLPPTTHQGHHITLLYQEQGRHNCCLAFVLPFQFVWILYSDPKQSVSVEVWKTTSVPSSCSRQSSFILCYCLPLCCPSISFSVDLCSFSPKLPVLCRDPSGKGYECALRAH